MRLRRAISALFLLAMTVVAVGCGSSSSTSSPAPASTTAAATSTTAPATTSPASTTSSAGTSLAPANLQSGVAGLPPLPTNTASAIALVNKLEVRPTHINWTTPLTKPIPGGKTIDFVQCGVPGCVNVGNWMAQAVKQIGWKVVRINGGLTAQTIQAAFDQAIRNKPNAVWIAGFPRVIYESQIATLKRMNIPVIANAIGDNPGNGLIANVSGPTTYVRIGGVMAAKFIADTNGKGNAYVVTEPDLSVQVSLESGFKSTVAAACPACKVAYVHNKGADIGTVVPGQVVSYLRAHPQVNTLVIGYTDLGTGVNAALKAAGLSGQVKIITQDNNPSVSTDIANGVPESLFSPATPENAFQGVDILIRYFSNDPTWKKSAQVPIPEWIMDKANEDPLATKGFIPSVKDFEAQFDALWHVKPKS